ncbi:DUF2798 domain-containing protein [Marinospirillum perlucidum]|uniref:DUF2798 domain-containing protein n=1 Tax=Marinospirillum perlucidum TaxID=1982602 RepID=UPI000DF3EA82|nr:DUF2798 domain-containing protein [Marinospirillum perlucidum]
MLFPPKAARYVFTFVMSTYMVTIMTFVITAVNTGFDAGFLLRWWGAFIIAWPVAYVLILIGAPRLQVLASRLIKKQPEQVQEAQE